MHWPLQNELAYADESAPLAPSPRSIEAAERSGCHLNSTHCTHVAQVVPGDVLIRLQVVDQHITAGGEVACVEGVVAAEAQATAAACRCGATRCTDLEHAQADVESNLKQPVQDI